MPSISGAGLAALPTRPGPRHHPPTRCGAAAAGHRPPGVARGASPGLRRAANGRPRLPWSAATQAPGHPTSGVPGRPGCSDHGARHHARHRAGSAGPHLGSRRGVRTCAGAGAGGHAPATAPRHAHPAAAWAAMAAAPHAPGWPCGAPVPALAAGKGLQAGCATRCHRSEGPPHRQAHPPRRPGPARAGCAPPSRSARPAGQEDWAHPRAAAAAVAAAGEAVCAPALLRACQ